MIKTRTLLVLLILTSRCLRQYFRLYYIVFLHNIGMQINTAEFQCGIESAESSFFLNFPRPIPRINYESRSSYLAQR